MADLRKALDTDPTLQAADRALEAEAAASPYRTHTIAMGQVGGSCARKSWYAFRWVFKEAFDAVSLKRFADGHSGEATIIERLKKVEGIELLDRDPVTGKQYTYLACDGHAKGKCDGKITGILQAPKKLHIFEAKVVAEKKLAEFRKIKADVGEKFTLKKWNEEYYGQSQLYMNYEGTDRHYCVVASPGCRDWDSCRTELDLPYVIKLKARMERIKASHEPLDKVSNKPDWWECKMCAFRGVCHNGDMPDRNCRTCLHSTPIENGQWHCERFGKTLSSYEQQAGCPAHKFLPSLVPGEVIEATQISVTYRLHTGAIWRDEEASNA